MITGAKWFQNWEDGLNSRLKVKRRKGARGRNLGRRKKDSRKGLSNGPRTCASNHVGNVRIGTASVPSAQARKMVCERDGRVNRTDMARKFRGERKERDGHFEYNGGIGPR